MKEFTNMRREDLLYYSNNEFRDMDLGHVLFIIASNIYKK